LVKLLLYLSLVQSWGLCCPSQASRVLLTASGSRTMTGSARPSITYDLNLKFIQPLSEGEDAWNQGGKVDRVAVMRSKLYNKFALFIFEWLDRFFVPNIFKALLESPRAHLHIIPELCLILPCTCTMMIRQRAAHSSSASRYARHLKSSSP
jgi:hypothetical protein